MRRDQAVWRVQRWKPKLETRKWMQKTNAGEVILVRDCAAARNGLINGEKIARQKHGFRIIVGSHKTAQADLHRSTENPATMSNPLELEFVLVSGDYAAMNAVFGGVKKYGAKFILVPTAEAARDCLNR